MRNLLLGLAGMLALSIAAGVGMAASIAPIADEAAYRKEIEDWRQRVDRGLRQDNGWLTLVGRDVLKPGANRIGSAPDNDVVLAGEISPPRLGTLHVAEQGKVRLVLAPGITMSAVDPLDQSVVAFTERDLDTTDERRDWVSLGRLAFHVIYVSSRERYVLRTADNQSAHRRDFGGRVWYPADPRYRVDAKFVAYDPPQTVEIVNVLGEVSDESMAGYVEFTLHGQRLKLDALTDENSLWFILRDQTAGSGTYPAGRFLVARKPENGRVTLDFNRAYNPPCAFSEFTTCPLPPPQNILPVRVEAGEKYLSRD